MSDSATNQPSVAPVEPGTVLAGKYRVERIIGQGGMGVVVEARHVVLDERVALKFLLPEFTRHPEGSARFLREAKAAVKIKSEHVARVSDVGTLENGAPYMVMEFLVGSDLSRLLQEHGTLPLEDAIDYVVQACEAIAEAHAHGIVHRDLKPANLFLTQRADGSPLVKVLDFGISKVAAAVENLTGTSAALGSALYMSPEQMRQTRSVDHRTDIYALGVSLFELLAGRQPFYAETLPQLCAEVLTGTPAPLRDIRPDAPAGFASALERAYARERDARYASVAEFVVALAPYAPGRTYPTIDRIARMGGLSLAAATAGGQRASYPSFAGGDSRSSAPGFREPSAPGFREPSAPGFREPSWPGLPPAFAPGQADATMPQRPPTPLPHTPWPGQGAPGGYPAENGAPGQAAPGAPEAFPAPPPHQQIVPGPYSAPMSTRAAATFASATHLGVSSDGRRPSPSPTALAAIAVLSAALVMGLIAASVFLLRRTTADAGGDASPTSETTSAAPLPSAAAEAPLPGAGSGAPEEPTIRPTGMATAAAAAPAPAEPSPSAAPSSAADPASAAASSSAAAPTATTAPAATAAPRATTARPAPAAAPRRATTGRAAPAAPQPSSTQRPPRGIDLNDPH
ncbi:protein kinase [Sorangium cellulosum]|uniref:Protein kinase n=1 Tax=Sorangium cellulosum TaxID=56 RepID=A0A4P2PTF2_SORCE|nr:serine/threonine-protein kinase [Sorangium cellulosum]AUX19899.1 protein kinase [Sorangium cellulosum]